MEGASVFLDPVAKTAPFERAGTDG